MKWRKSTYSSSGGASCVEVARSTLGVMVRDTKQDHLGKARTVISISPDAWQRFTSSLR